MTLLYGFPKFGSLIPSIKEFIEDFAEIHPVSNSLMILEIPTLEKNKMTMAAKNIFLGNDPLGKSQGRFLLSRGTQRKHPHRFLSGAAVGETSIAHHLVLTSE